MKFVAAIIAAGLFATACSSEVVVKLETEEPATTAIGESEQFDADLSDEPTTTAVDDVQKDDSLESSPDEQIINPDEVAEIVDFPDEFEGQVRPVAVSGNPLPFLVDTHSDEAVGGSIPSIIGEDFEGNTVAVRSTDDTATLVVFLAHWCPHCNNEIPEINRIRDADAWPDGLRVVGVSTAVSPQRPNFPPERWLEEKDWSYEIMADAFDSSRSSFIAAEAFGVTGFPFMVLIDESGLVRGRWSGELGALALAELVTSLINPPADV